MAKGGISSPWNPRSQNRNARKVKDKVTCSLGVVLELLIVSLMKVMICWWMKDGEREGEKARTRRQ